MASTILSGLPKRGLAIHDEQLKSILEPDQNNRYVAIHVPTSDYADGRSSGDAMREILKRQSVDGQLVMRKIGPEPNYGMASRVLQGELLAESVG